MWLYTNVYYLNVAYPKGLYRNVMDSHTNTHGISQEKKPYQSEYGVTDGWGGDEQWKSDTHSAASDGGQKSRPTIVMYVCGRKSSV